MHIAQVVHVAVDTPMTADVNKKNISKKMHIAQVVHVAVDKPMTTDVSTAQSVLPRLSKL